MGTKIIIDVDFLFSLFFPEFSNDFRNKVQNIEKLSNAWL